MHVRFLNNLMHNHMLLGLSVWNACDWMWGRETDECMRTSHTCSDGAVRSGTDGLESIGCYSTHAGYSIQAH